MLCFKSEERGGKIFYRPVFFQPLIFLLLLSAASCAPRVSEPQASQVLRIYDWKSGVLYAEVPAKSGDQLFFGWIHSLENIPWNEYFHIERDLSIVLDAITFPAFGAGIPENKGTVCYIEDGLIHMEKIDQRFEELIWLNSHTAVQDIKLGGALISRGSDLPQHTRLRLVVENRR